MSVSCIGMASVNDFSVASMLRWDSTTPFGTPVEPDVYIIMAVSDGVGGTSSVIQNIIFIGEPTARTAVR